MQKFFSVLFVSTLLVACGGTPQPQNAQQDAMGNPADNKQVAIQVAPENLATLKDVVCGMSVKPDAIGDTAMVDGRVYPFCATECKNAFLADVAKYKISQ